MAKKVEDVMEEVAEIDEKLEGEYKNKTKKSAILYHEARQYIPLGVHSYVRFYKPYPIYIKEAKGARIIDVDGNEYIDFSMAYGALLVGHAHPLIVKAVKEQAERGTLYTMPHEHSTELAKEIIKRFPVEQVRFTNSGTEATMHALRLARGYTDREKIIKVGGAYHGVHDYLLTKDDPASEEIGIPVPSSKGIPSAVQQTVLMGVFNDLGSFERLFNIYKGQIAGVIVEPVMMNRGIILPDKGFLPGLRDLCHHNRALLIFDEVKTGVKVAWGGATEYYNVKPDIICLAKSIGGGLPIAAFAASKKIMSVIESKEVAHAGTYGANPLSIVAAVTTLRHILTKKVYEKIENLNKRLIDGYNSVIKTYDLPAHTVSIGACGTVHFCRDPVRNHKEWAKQVDTDKCEKYWLGMLVRGIIPCAYPLNHEEWTISVQHTEDDIDKHLEAFESIANKLKQST